LTDVNGEFQMMFTAPETTELVGITISATATKTGYVDGQNQTSLTVNPAAGPDWHALWAIFDNAAINHSSSDSRGCSSGLDQEENHCLQSWWRRSSIASALFFPFFFQRTRE
jgi:hypothetical protein